MKIPRSAAVVLAAVILIAGTAVAVQAATSAQTVRLCVPKTVGVVTVADTCPSGSKSVRVATKAAIDALSDRVTQLEGANAGAPQSISFELTTAQLEGQIGDTVMHAFCAGPGNVALNRVQADNSPLVEGVVIRDPAVSTAQRTDSWLSYANGIGDSAFFAETWIHGDLSLSDESTGVVDQLDVTVRWSDRLGKCLVRGQLTPGG